jgi:uncharacterized protein (DUF2336 family)
VSTPGSEKTVMIVHDSVIDELEEAIASKEIGRRADTLRRVTDLFVSGCAGISDDQIALFDDVMGLLAREIESAARARFGHRMAAIAKAPPRIMRALALDDAIEVAGPVLSRSVALDEAALLEGARTKSQDHLLAISRRETLAEVVTDVLVERGDRRVAHSTAENPGARFSEFGYSTLVERSGQDPELALRVLSRPDVPRQHLLKVFADASETVRRKLEAGDRGKANLLRDMVARASEEIQAESRERSAEHAAARAFVRGLDEAGKLSAAQLKAFAADGKFDEAAIALSIMSGLSIGLVERLLTQDRSEPILIVAKAIGLSWEAARALLLLQAGSRVSSTHEIDQSLAKFDKLRTETAKTAVQFYRLRERAVIPAPGLN